MKEGISAITSMDQLGLSARAYNRILIEILQSSFQIFRTLERYMPQNFDDLKFVRNYSGQNIVRRLRRFHRLNRT